ncbi:MAG: alpha/beta fold hydrolase [Microthrixaceae bacterium]
MNLDEWRRLGTTVQVGGEAVFVVDSPAENEAEYPPLLVIHGFPTSSVDYAPVLGALRSRRRVVLFDLPGFGLSAKVDRPYSIGSSADATAGVIDALDLTEFDLLTHDMGDTVGGEILARHLEGELRADGKPVSIGRRVVTNGSIYLEMAQLTPAQHLLWEAPDERLPDEISPDASSLAAGLAATMAPAESVASNPDPEDLLAAAESVTRDGGALLLPRLIRYLSDRRENEARYTGAIETHPSPLGIVWGAEDPIAVVAMADRLARRRSDATLEVLDGIGHYPSIEAPEVFATAVLRSLNG